MVGSTPEMDYIKILAILIAFSFDFVSCRIPREP